MYRITERIWQGGYPMTEDFATLWDAGVRWLFNLDLPYYEWRELEARGFQIIGVGLKDMGRDRPDRWWQALAPLARADRELRQGSYVHCNAGISRSPTLVWLHLVLGGMGHEAARELITKANPHACPGDPAILDDGLLVALQAMARQQRGDACR
jgi:protein-tyrosine phosphatase